MKGEYALALWIFILIACWIFAGQIDKYHNQEIQKQDSIILMLKELNNE